MSQVERAGNFDDVSSRENELRVKSNMKILKWFGGGVLVLVILFVIGGLSMSGDFDLSRSTTIQAPTSKIHELTGELRNWEKWMPWSGMDDTMEITYGETTSGVGGTMSWTSTEQGNGTVVITESSVSTGLKYDISFEGFSTSQCVMTYEVDGEAVKVSWGMSGSMDGIMGAWFSLLMEPLVGGNYEDGLAALKEKVEGS